MNEKKLLDDIKKYGWAVLSIENSAYLPNFSYTVGLWKNYNHPELICFGLTSKTLQTVLNIGGEIVKSGKIIEVGKIYDDFFENGSTSFLNVAQANIADYFGYAQWFNDYKEFEALQLIWTDRDDRFPWDSEYSEEFTWKQPLLDRNSAFKFREPKNLATFTTNQWLSQNKPILHVVHESKGDWQFLTGDQMPEDAIIVALEQIIKKDPTLNTIFNLDYGEEARREYVGGEWIRRKL